MHASLRASGAISLLFATHLAAAADADALEEVVVTAELRDRGLTELPTSVTVLDAQLLQSAGVQHFQDVLPLVPNLNWSAGTSRPRYFQLRGIGELSQWQGAPNPSVGFLIDGIDFSGVGMPATLADVERIEVLRGPQGTAYGANALAGLIAVNTRAPSREPSASADVTFGDYATRGATAVIGGPIGDGETAWRFVADNYRSDGFRHDAFLGRSDTNGYDESNARLRVRARPFEHLRTDVTAMWADLDNGYDAFSIDNSRTTLSDKPGQDTQLARALAVRLDYDAADFDVIGRFSYAKSRSVYSFDGDWGNDLSWGANSPYDYFERFDRERRTLSADVRIVSRESVSDGGEFAWLAGVYSLHTGEDSAQHDVWRDRLFGDGASEFASRYSADNVAAYGELEFRLGASNVLAIGARGERRAADYDDSDGERFSPDEAMFGGSLSLRREFGPQRSVYVTFARGYKAGGFNIGGEIPADKRTFDGETLHNLEVGFRGARADGRLNGDIALFYMRRQDQQVPTGEQLVPGDPLTFVMFTDNAASGENYGLEGTLQWRLSTRWMFDVRGALLRARYRDYRYGEVNLSGREQAHAPEYQYDLGAEYRGVAGFFARIDVAGQDDFYFDETNDARAPVRVLTNLKAGWANERWRAEVWVRNLFDEYYSQRGFWFGNEPPDFTPTRYVQAGDPRHAGVTVAYIFR